MRVKIEVEMETEDGEYNVVFRNISDPGEDMDYKEVMTILQRVFGDVDTKIDTAGSA